MARRGHRPINRPAQTNDTPTPKPEVAVVTSETVVVSPEPPPAREKSLHELNLEARATDRWHAEQRRLAQAKIDEEIAPMMRGVQRSARVMRRTQKPLRPPVKP